MRAILDEEGCRPVQIVLSGNLDEYAIQALLEAQTPVDAFGIGTHLVVSEDAPSLDMAYKLEAYAGRARRKRSPGKATWPGVKQVYRELTAQGQFLGDRVALAGEAARGSPLLQQVMRDGARCARGPTLGESRDLCRGQLAGLPPPLRRMDEGPAGYPVSVSPAIAALARELDALED